MTWEYHIEPSEYHTDTLKATLGSLGSREWELAAVDSLGRLIFKRPVEPPPLTRARAYRPADTT